TNSSTGDFVYTPNSNKNGNDEFTFRVTDGKTQSNVAGVSITVAPVNDAPTASASTISTIVNTPVNGTLTGVDIDGDTLTYSIVTNPSKGMVQITNLTTGAFSYSPTNNQIGFDSFTFRVRDGSLFSNTA